MKFRIVTNLPDNLAQLPSLDITTSSDFYSQEFLDYLGSIIEYEFCNDYGTPFGVGTSIMIERVE